jgi:thiamine kinase-like enzyme
MNIVDWESASIGDPAWDIGSVFQEFIKFWLYLLPTTGRESAEQLIMSTAHPISNIQSALRSFWNSYTRYAKIDANESNELLIRSAKFCAARLVQSAYESLYSSMEVPNNIIYMIQTSLNIFDRTDKAIIQLLGIPFRSERMA